MAIVWPKLSDWVLGSLEAPEPWAVRAVQLDLARQMETLDFIRWYCDFAREQGFNTLVLYLEGRVRTETFPFRPAAESYTLEDMAAIVAHANQAGLAVVPAVPSLAHCEHFVSCPELAHLAEEAQGGYRMYPGTNTFCPSSPDVQEFWRAYWTELAQVFTGPDIHVGCDEAWNLGYCPSCRSVWQSEGLGGLFTQHIQRMHALAESLGKRMWMWDDFYEMFPEQLEETPKSVVMCHWNYEEVMEPGGGPAHFVNRFRQDWLAEYERLGLEALVCPWAWYPWNVETITAYGRRHRVRGGLLTQWEMSHRFHEESLPVVAMTGRLWSDPTMPVERAWRAGVEATVPGASRTLGLAVRELARIPKTYPRSDMQQYLHGPLSKADRVQQSALETGLALLRLAREDYAGPGEEVLEDLAATARLESLRLSLRDVLPVIYDPRRTEAEAAEVQERLRAAEEGLDALIALREPLHNRKRPGMFPESGAVTHLWALREALVDADERLDRDPTPEDWLLQLRLYLPDPTGCPVLTIYGVFEREQRELASGIFKQAEMDRMAFHTLQIPFASPAPPDEITLEVWGYGGEGVCYLEAYNPEVRVTPRAVRVESGEVRDPQALLRDDSRAAYLGERDVLRAIHDPQLADARARLTVTLA